jgi:hypothetical protein
MKEKLNAEYSTRNVRLIFTVTLEKRNITVPSTQKQERLTLYEHVAKIETKQNTSNNDQSDKTTVA